MNQYAISTLVRSVDDIQNAISLVKSIRLFMKIDTICMVTGNIKDIDELKKLFTVVDTVIDIGNLTPYNMLQYDKYYKIAFIENKFVIEDSIYHIFLPDIPVKGSNIIVLSPNKFGYKVLIDNKDNIKDIYSFYSEYGYIWSDVEKVNITENEILKERFLNDTYLRIDQKYKTYLSNLLNNIIGPPAAEIVNKYYNIYQKCLIPKSYNTSVNYDLLEAYGDLFLKATMGWLVSYNPGIIEADQVDTLRKYFENKFILEKIAKNIKLVNYIPKDAIKVFTTKTESNKVFDTTKLHSDLVEALVGAIAFTWQEEWEKRGRKDNMDGNYAVMKFVIGTIPEMINIDAVNYRTKYLDQKRRFKEMIESIGADRKLIHTDFSVDKNKNIIIAVLSYKDKALGKSTLSMRNLTYKVAKRYSELAAYEDGYENGNIDRLIKSLS